MNGDVELGGSGWDRRSSHSDVIELGDDDVEFMHEAQRKKVAPQMALMRLPKNVALLPKRREVRTRLARGSSVSIPALPKMEAALGFSPAPLIEVDVELDVCIEEGDIVSCTEQVEPDLVAVATRRAFESSRRARRAMTESFDWEQLAEASEYDLAGKHAAAIRARATYLRQPTLANLALANELRHAADDAARKTERIRRVADEAAQIAGELAAAADSAAEAWVEVFSDDDLSEDFA